MIAESLRPPPISSYEKPGALPGETIVCNDQWRRVSPRLSVLVPVYHYDASVLIGMIGKCLGSGAVEIILYDDGSSDPELTFRLWSALQDTPSGGALVTASENRGRSAGRNRLEQLARSEWMLFLDADMLPDDTGFLQRYLTILDKYQQPALVVGGFSLKLAIPTPATKLHWEQCMASECIPASDRQKNPGRFVFTSNVLVHRDIMTVIPFDDAFRGWGWEDVDWGLRAAKRFPVLHIDNPATHMGLDTPGDLLRKYGNSGANFWLAADRHPEALKNTPLYTLSRVLAHIPGHKALKWLSAGIAKLPGWSVPMPVQLFALKLYRAAVYAEAHNAKSDRV